MPNLVDTTELQPRLQTVSAKAAQVLSRLVAKSTETLLPEATVTKLRTGREWRRWIDSITCDSLADLTQASLEAKRRVFKAQVRRVEIETHAKCNRICSFCPNVVVDRRMNQTVMSGRVLKRIFTDLGAIDYTGQIVVARYSEPLANLPHLYECISSARGEVPHAELCITTNTDYLTRTILDKLHALGLNTLYLSLYLRDRERWSIELARTYTDRLYKKLGVEALSRSEFTTNILATSVYKGMNLRSNCHNWEQYGTDRGGSLERYRIEPRVGPCRDPFETFVIDYNGSVVPCCAVRSDLPEHGALVAGDLSRDDSSIFDIYAGRLSAWRRSLVAFGPKEFPCSTCKHRDMPVDLVPAAAKTLKRRLQQIGRSEDYRPPTAHCSTVEAPPPSSNSKVFHILNSAGPDKPSSPMAKRPSE
jgi:MoaA/NifB/PqqE/SkfB family radical SAM enzyme